MPSKIKVKISSVESTTRGQYNGLEIKGYNHTDNKPYKNFTFETTKDGQLTKVAEAIQGANSGDWFEFTVDDTKYKNITFAAPTQAVAGANPPANFGGGVKSSGNGMTKAEWAAKDAAKEKSMARHKALQTAIVACSADGKGVTKTKMGQIEKLTFKFEAYLLNGVFDEDTLAVVEPSIEPVAPEVVDSGDPGPTVEDDIPF